MPPGRGGRNCEPELIPKGLPAGQFGLAALPLPVGRQSPGLSPAT